MSSKRNHATRSRKTYRFNKYAARNALRGSLPYDLRRATVAALLARNKKPSEKKEEPGATMR